MADAREDILKAIRAGLKLARLPDVPAERPFYSVPQMAGGAAEFVSELERLSGQAVQVASAADAAQAVAGLCLAHGWKQVWAWVWDEIACPGLAEALSAAHIEVVHEGSTADLERLPVGITGADAALAESGTLVLRSGAGRSLLTSLMPPVHIALLETRRIFPDLHAYLNSLPDPAAHVRAASNLVLISGPSRTADIEQVLTLGVHGPRELIVVLWG